MAPTLFIKLPDDWSIRFHNYLTCSLNDSYLWDDAVWFTELVALYYQYRFFSPNNDNEGITETFNWVLATYDQSLHANQTGFEFFESTYREIQYCLTLVPGTISKLEFALTDKTIDGLWIWYEQ